LYSLQQPLEYVSWALDSC